MSESAPTAAPGGAARADRHGPRGGEAERGLFARIALFVRQVVAELRKVVRPTRSELTTYTGVVLVFVAIVMAFITGVDLLIGKATLWIFGS